MWQQIKYYIDTEMCGNIYLDIWGRVRHWIGSKGGRERALREQANSSIK